MKKVIYQVNTYDHNSTIPTNCVYCMEKYAVPTVKSYAQKIGADYHCLTLDDNPSGIHGFHAGVRLKMKVWRDAHLTDYDHLLFLDYDILVKDNAPDIFETEEYKALGGYWATHCRGTRVMKYRDSLKEQGVIVNDFWNGGVCLSDRETAIRIGKHIPEDEILFGSKDHWGNGYDYLHDEPYLGHVIEKEGIRVRSLREGWNVNWKSQQPALNKPSLYFVHYQGKRGKLELCRINNDHKS